MLRCMKGMNLSPRLENVLSHRATHLSAQKDICIPRMREILFRMGQRGVCEDVRTEIIRKPGAIQLHSRYLDYNSHVRT
jgi:hypothetical protein